MNHAVTPLGPHIIKSEQQHLEFMFIPLWATFEYPLLAISVRSLPLRGSKTISAPQTEAQTHRKGLAHAGSGCDLNAALPPSSSPVLLHPDTVGEKHSSLNWPRWKG